MQTNLDLNQGIDECKVAELNWGEPLPENVPHKPDVLLLAGEPLFILSFNLILSFLNYHSFLSTDCVYLEVAFQPLVDTMIEMSTKDTEILVSLPFLNTSQFQLNLLSIFLFFPFRSVLLSKTKKGKFHASSFWILSLDSV